MFKLNTGSDVSIVNINIVNRDICHFSICEEKIVYPTGGKVLVQFKSKYSIILGNFSVDMIYAVEIEDDCILKIDFFQKIKMDKIFGLFLGNSVCKESSEDSFCSRVLKLNDISDGLKKFYERNSNELDDSQKNVFVKFFKEFQNVFSEKIVAGNCDVIQHKIKLLDSTPIKQTPSRILLQMRS